jgi:hypothetical protein
MRRLKAIAALAAVLALGAWSGAWSSAKAAGAFAASPFADWAAVVVAGDFHAHSGAPSEAFDNARRDVTQELIGAGFSRQNIREFSVRPDRYPQEHLMLSNSELIGAKLADLASQARGGCLVYFSSHGSPAGVLVGPTILSPAGLSQMVDEACGDRPTVVIISACFSGVFVPPLSRPDREVLTAARPDRTSFGCSESDRYPYFDACMVQTLPKAKDFVALGRGVQDCVAAREKATGMTPPSEPQMFVGSELRPLIPFYPLTSTITGVSELSRSGGSP